MASRLELHEFLCEILGSRNVYFNTPESVKMNYPAIRYILDGIDNRHANNVVYTQSNYYEIVVIDKDPDSEIRDKISKLPMCSFTRSYKADNLNHWVFRLYY